MRSRNLKPGFFKNDELAKCTIHARYLYGGLWCYSDRLGRCEDRPLRIKAEVLPYDNCDVDALLAELAAAGFIVRYEVAGQKYIAIPKFLDHQNPHKNEAESKIPEPPGTSTDHVPDNSGASTVQVPDITSTNPADSLLRNPSSLIPESRKKRAARTASPNPDHKKAIDGFCRRWKEKHGSEFILQTENKKTIVSVLKSLNGDLGRMAAVLDVYFADDDKFIAETRRHDPGTLKSQLSKYNAEAEKTNGRSRNTYDEAVRLGFVTPSENGTAEAVAP